MKLILTFFFILLIVDNIFSQDYVIKIEYQKNDDNTVWNKGIDEIAIKLNQKEVKRLVSDVNGFIKIPKSAINNFSNYDVFLTSIGIEENYLTLINKNTPDTLIISFPKKYILESNYAICPKCSKSDKVCKVSTEPILIMNIVGQDTSFSPINEKDRIYYFGSSVWNIFNPQWFCIRDSITF